MFCLYEHIRPDTGAVFYVGMGQGKRPHSPRSRNRHWKDIVAEAGGFTVRIVAENIEDEELAYFAEEERIDKLKMLGVKLCNMTDGGKGAKGHKPSKETLAKLSAVRKGRKFSEEHRANMSAAQKGKSPSAETRAKISATLTGRKLSAETIAKRSATRTGRKQSEETIAKRVASLRGKTRAKATCLYCGKTGGVNMMKRWHFENCKQYPDTQS